VVQSVIGEQRGALAGEEPGFATIGFEARDLQFRDPEGGATPARGRFVSF
jgi:hypothetical protein